MKIYESSIGKGNTTVLMTAQQLGEDLVIHIYNNNAHIGAVAVSEYDFNEDRASTSVITRLGHKDDTIAYKAAYLICKHTKKAVCAIAGIHLEKITDVEIKQFIENSNQLVEDFISKGCNID